MKVAIGALAALLLVAGIFAGGSVRHGRELSERARIFDNYCNAIFRAACREVEAPLQLPHKLPDEAALLACTNASRRVDEGSVKDSALQHAYKSSCSLVDN